MSILGASLLGYMSSPGQRLVMTEVVIYRVSVRPEILQRQGDCHGFDANLGYRDPIQNKQKVSRLTLYRCVYAGSCPKLRVPVCLFGTQLKESPLSWGPHLSRSVTQPHLFGCVLCF